MKDFKVNFYLSDDEYFTALRLVSGAICSVANVDVDTLEDFKLCVSESALIFKNCGFEQVQATFCVDGGVVAEICGLGGNPVAGDTTLSLSLISALLEKAQIEQDKEVVKKVILRI